MFKKDDYIVLLKYEVELGIYNYRINYCYKQRLNNDYISTYLDSNGNTGNGWSTYNFKEGRDLWRYATKQEAAEYERLGKPYDVTTLKPQFEEGKWYKDTSGYYGKFMLKNKNYEYPEKFPSKEYIDRNKKYHNNGNYFSIDKMLPGEVPISEIAEYLPENYPDLKKTSGLSLSDVKAGEYYYVQYSHYPSSGKCIIKAQYDGNFNSSPGMYADRLEKEYNVYYCHNAWSCYDNIKLATKEEREWLDACINAKVFVPKPSSKQSKPYSLQVDQWYSFEFNSCTQYGMFSKVSVDHYYFDHWIINGSQYEPTACLDRFILKSIKEVSFEDVLSNVSEQAEKRLLEIFPKKVSTEELNRKLLNEVIEKYPIGTQYMSINSNGHDVGVHEITKKPYVFRYRSDGSIDGIIGNAGHNFIYVNGHWAKKLGSTEQTASSINLASDQHSLFLESASSTNLVTLSSGPLFTEPQSSSHSFSPSARLEVREEQQTKKQLTKINKLSFTKI
jgi:hypothetical protein